MKIIPNIDEIIVLNVMENKINKVTKRMEKSIMSLNIF